MNNLKTLRLKANKTQSDIAAILNVSRQMYSKYENGISQMPDEALKKLSSIFKVSIDYILDNPNVKTGNNNVIPSDTEYSFSIPKKGEKTPQDLKNFLDQSEVMFDGEAYNLTPEEKEMVMQSLKVAFYAAKRANKRKKNDPKN